MGLARPASARLPSQEAALTTPQSRDGGDADLPADIRVLDAPLYQFLYAWARGIPGPVYIYDDDGRRSEEALGMKLFRDCGDQSLRLSREQLLTFLKSETERLGEPFEERATLVRLFEYENLRSEAMVDNLWVFIDPWEVRALLSQDREAAKAQAAEDPTVGGGNGNEPEAKAGAAEASPKATRFRPGRLKGSGDGTMVVHLRDVEGVVDYDSVRQILGIEGVSKKQTTDMYSRSRAAHTAGCPVCVHRQPLPTKVADRLEQWKQRR